MEELNGFALRCAEFHLRRFVLNVYVSRMWLYTGLIYLLIQASEMWENEISEKKIFVLMLRIIHDG
jgi:hypothetical protein